MGQELLEDHPWNLLGKNHWPNKQIDKNQNKTNKNNNYSNTHTQKQDSPHPQLKNQN